MRRNRWARWLVLAASLIAPSNSMATPVEFVFTTTISGTPAIPGVSAGDAVTLTVTADNGSNTLVSQIWELTDVGAGIALVGTVYGAIYFGPHSSNTKFETNSGGELVFAFFADIDGNNEDVNGTTALVGFFNNAMRDGVGNIAFFSPESNTESAWTATIVPEPSTLSLSAVGLLGLAAARRRRVAG